MVRVQGLATGEGNWSFHVPGDYRTGTTPTILQAVALATDYAVEHEVDVILTHEVAAEVSALARRELRLHGTPRKKGETVRNP